MRSELVKGDGHQGVSWGKQFDFGRADLLPLAGAPIVMFITF